MKLIITLAMALALTGCATLFGPKYHYDLDASATSSDAVGKLSVEGLERDQIRISFKNLGKSSAKIHWDDCTVVDNRGNVRKVIHNGVRYAAAGEPMAPTSVPSGATINDFVGYADGIQLLAGTWATAPVVQCSSYDCIKETDGQHILVVLSVESEGKRHEYSAKLRLKPEPKPQASGT